MEANKKWCVNDYLFRRRFHVSSQVSVHDWGWIMYDTSQNWTFLQKTTFKYYVYINRERGRERTIFLYPHTIHINLTVVIYINKHTNYCISQVPWFCCGYPNNISIIAKTLLHWRKTSHCNPSLHASVVEMTAAVCDWLYLKVVIHLNINISVHHKKNRYTCSHPYVYICTHIVYII